MEDRHTSGMLFLLYPLLLLIGACASQGPYTVEMMPAPAVYQEAPVDPFTDLRPMREAPPSAILFATTRAPSPPDAPSADRFYGDERSWAITLGEAHVVSGDSDLTWEEARKISLLKNKVDDYPLSVDRTTEFGVLGSTLNFFSKRMLNANEQSIGDERFAETINAYLAESRINDVFVYVHGFRTNFQSPQLVAAGLWHYLAYNGAFLTYSWPATMDRFDYAGNSETADWSAGFLRLFLEYLAEETQAKRIHVIGYSSGTRVVARALEELALLNHEKSDAELRSKLKLGNVILVGSDVDRGIFGSFILDGILRVPENLSLYISRSDKALELSRWLFHRVRVGEIPHDKVNPLVLDLLRDNPRLRVIDVSDAEGANHGTGHEYLRASPWVSSDILTTLMYDMTPTERGLVQVGDNPIWTFPEDYMDNLMPTVIQKYKALTSATRSERSARASSQ